MALFTGVFAVMGWGSLLRQVGSALIYPFQWAADGIGRAAEGFTAYFSDIRDLQSEADSLRAENESLRAELNDAAILRDETAWLYYYLSIKEAHTDYTFLPASAVSVSSASSGGQDGSFAVELTLNRGTAAGVAVGMPVITPLGLVGVVVEVGPVHARVRTVLNTAVSVGAAVARTAENGLCEGDYAEMHHGRAVLRYLTEEADIQPGDLIITDGKGGVYPYGIPVGRVEEVRTNAYSRTTEALVRPFADFTALHQVMVVTSSLPGTPDSGGGGP